MSELPGMAHRWDEEELAVDDFDVDALLARGERTTLVISLILIGGSFLIYGLGGGVTGALAIGCAIGMANFLALRWIAGKALGDARGPSSVYVLLFVAKFSAAAGAVFFLIYYLKMNALAVGAGYSSWVAALILETVAGVFTRRLTAGDD